MELVCCYFNWKFFGKHVHHTNKLIFSFTESKSALKVDLLLFASSYLGFEIVFNECIHVFPKNIQNRIIETNSYKRGTSSFFNYDEYDRMDLYCHNSVCAMCYHYS